MQAKHPEPHNVDSDQEMNEEEVQQDSDDEESATGEDTTNSSGAESEGESQDNDSDSVIWESLLEEVLEDDANVRDDSGEFKWSKILKRVKEKVYTWLDMADKIRESPTFEKIQEEEDRLQGQGYSEPEAKHAAWENRKYLIKGVLLKAATKLPENGSDSEETQN
jgi:hypothetical protein